MGIVMSVVKYVSIVKETKEERIQRNMKIAMRSSYAWHNPNSPMFAPNHARMAIGMLNKINDASDLPANEQRIIAKRYTKSIMGIVDKLNLWAQGKYD